MEVTYDVLVIGGGHAGIEAAHASAKLGVRTGLVSFNKNSIGTLSCNPAVGGLAKSQLVKEIDALGGLQGRIADRAAIQIRVLNESKGPAVRATRVQCDKVEYPKIALEMLSKINNLTLIEGEVTEINRLGPGDFRVVLASGNEIFCSKLVITTGTFLKSTMFCGDERSQGGRFGEASSQALSESFSGLGLKLRRLKTGTPPRLHKDSIDWSVCEEQISLSSGQFSFYQKPNDFNGLGRISCYITYTNTATHSVIADNFHRSPMYRGDIVGVGPRYCPSIEDKVKRFSDKDRHQVFLEPESLSLPDIYVNGVSTSLPAEVQEEFIRSIKGLERAVFLRHGYAVEYDCLEAQDLFPTLEHKDQRGMYFAGQVNGTSGYEEAAAQGLMAGINAARSVQGLGHFVLGRSQAYIGVLIDDLTSKKLDEPYRMFTSRAEYRLHLREDNADYRLSEIGRQVGLLSEVDFEEFQKKKARRLTARKVLQENILSPKGETLARLAAFSLPVISDVVSLEQYLKRPEVRAVDILRWSAERHESVVDALTLEGLELEGLETEIKYEGYLKRELELFEAASKGEATQIPSDFDYGSVPGLSHEATQHLVLSRPATLGQASKVAGVTPSALACLFVFLKQNVNSGRVA